MFKTSIFAAATALLFAAPAFAEINVHDSYARASSPVAKSGAAFLVIQNTGEADRLIGVSSDAAAKTELHTHLEDDNGVMRMIHVEEGFELPADGEIAMQRGGKHVMLMGLTDPFEQGDVISITLTFENAGDMVIEVPVDLERQDQEMMEHGDMNKASDN
ncbi:copper chaperone PCu(A)C [Marivita sp. S2033]|uniref:copper chaperone PCu(A)C n=1 Tax=Marivita sp. S2033 TaxID=3373187 RepID=UPI003982A24F